jgi:hypothetical protein
LLARSAYRPGSKLPVPEAALCSKVPVLEVAECSKLAVDFAFAVRDVAFAPTAF